MSSDLSISQNSGFTLPIATPVDGSDLGKSLYWAVYTENLDKVIKTLTDYAITDDVQIPALLLAAELGKTPILSCLLNAAPVSSSILGATLIRATLGGNLECVQLALENSGQISQFDIDYAIFYAATGGYIDILDVLIENAPFSQEMKNFSIDYSLKYGQITAANRLVASGPTSLHIRLKVCFANCFPF